MRKSLLINLHSFYAHLGLSALISLSISHAHASSHNESTYSDAVFAANAVQTPITNRDDDEDSYYRYGYRDRYAEMSRAQQQKQKTYEEQKYRDAEISYIQRSNESDADYQARMAKEQNPIWLRHQAQVKLKAQILDHQESKLNQPANAPIATNNTSTNNSSSDTAPKDQASSPSNRLDDLMAKPTTPAISPDSIPREMTMGKYMSYSLFYLLSLAWSLIFLVGLIRRKEE